MSSMSHEFDLSGATMLPPAQKRGGAVPGPEELAAQWDAVHQAAAAVATLAQLGTEEQDEATLSLPARAATLGEAHYAIVACAIDDLAAVMQPGLRALLAMTDKGEDTTSAALTLWREFHKARHAIVALVPES
ncbi:hypothetical protein [Qipengyuania aquimaris]|uniref:hypothetical protein n=1 Tax=Qipengyuania aquimaris TaxID=255984 RepID=UPI001FD2D801|nr:hypothetical protein [Qipengyuania aquimaris]UOR16078.1 hypothetical protein LCM05_03280 [Qipengyuania aquimaris]